MDRIGLYYDTKNRRGQSVVKMLAAGIAQSGLGDKVTLYTEREYTGQISADIVCWYGLSGNLMRLAEEMWQQDAIPGVFFDLPYWGRKRELYPQHHRFAINGYQPTPYFQAGHTPDRFRVFERPVQPWRVDPSHEILVAGMSEKQCQVWGLGSSLAFHTAMIEKIRERMGAPIAWRPKPSCPQSAHPIPGTRYANGPLAQELQRVGSIYTYRSNTAIDGLIAGIRCVILSDHPAQVLSEKDNLSIETREQLCADLAYCQVSMQELRNGWAWTHIREEINRCT